MTCSRHYSIITARSQKLLCFLLLNTFILLKGCKLDGVENYCIFVHIIDKNHPNI